MIRREKPRAETEKLAREKESIIECKEAAPRWLSGPARNNRSPLSQRLGLCYRFGKIATAAAGAAAGTERLIVMSDDWIKILSAWAGAVVIAGGIYILGGYDSFMVAIGRIAPQIEAVAAYQPATARVANPAAAPVAETSGPIGPHASVPNPPVKPAEENSDADTKLEKSAKPAKSARPERQERQEGRRHTEIPGLPILQQLRNLPFFGGLR
jgi:hypothetical protein